MSLLIATYSEDNYLKFGGIILDKKNNFFIWHLVYVLRSLSVFNYDKSSSFGKCMVAGNKWESLKVKSVEEEVVLIVLINCR